MDDPINEIRDVVHKLTQGSPKVQEETINGYFTSNASFTHPFCRTGSFEGSRLLIHAIFQWYKVMSPKINLTVNSVAYDPSSLTMYVDISQVFAIWFIPFHRSPVNLVTVLKLTQSPGSSKYYITSQNDLYQVDQFVRFFAPWGIGSTTVLLWHMVATAFCVILALLGMPLTWAEQLYSNRRKQLESTPNEANGERKGVNGATSGSRIEEDRVKRLMAFGSEGVSPAKGQTTTATTETTEHFGNLQVVT
nr:hypothetical protein CFP56_03056 [Quercus suber]